MNKKIIIKYIIIILAILMIIVISINTYVKISTKKQIIEDNNFTNLKDMDEILVLGADSRKYVGETYREVREILARNKDFIKCIIKPEPTFLGESIPVSGNGDMTND